MSDNIQLGKIIEGDAFRDAIHIAVAPVVAGEYLPVGSHVELDERGHAVLGSHPIGIVDPFLKTSPDKGERFYLCLYPNTVTGMRHMWIHPAFRRIGL